MEVYDNGVKGMDSRKLVLRETGVIAAGEAVGVALMFGVFALLGRFDLTVLAGGIAGGLLAVLNFFFMAVNTCNAADKAVADDVKGGRSLLRFSYATRMLVLFAILFALIKSGVCNVFAAVVPLLFVRITITVAEFFRKPEEK